MIASAPATQVKVEHTFEHLQIKNAPLSPVFIPLALPRDVWGAYQKLAAMRWRR